LLHYLVGDYDDNILKYVEGEENVVRAIIDVDWKSKLFNPTPHYIKE